MRKTAPRKDKATISSWRIFAQTTPAILSMVKVASKHPLSIVQMLKQGTAARRRIELTAVKRTLPYEIPTYKKEMPSYKSDKLYLKPGRLIESNAPEIVAMANQLGALQKSDMEYAEACFNFVKKKIWFSFAAPLRGALGALRNGEGLCFDKVHLFIALCRAGGIPSRFRLYKEAFSQNVYNGLTEGDPIMKEWYDSTGYFLMHTMAEAFVDGEWRAADFSIDSCYEAALGLPLSRFGDEPEGVWNWAVPGGTIRCAELPSLFAFAVNSAMKLNKNVMLVAQERWEKEGLEMGKKVLEEAGGEEGYDRKIRQTYKAVLPEVSRKLFKALKEAEDPTATPDTEIRTHTTGSTVHPRRTNDYDPSGK